MFLESNCRSLKDNIEDLKKEGMRDEYHSYVTKYLAVHKFKLLTGVSRQLTQAQQNGKPKYSFKIQYRTIQK